MVANQVWLEMLDLTLVLRIQVWRSLETRAPGETGVRAGESSPCYGHVPCRGARPASQETNPLY